MAVGGLRLLCRRALAPGPLASAAVGGVFGAVISVVVNNALIEISITPFCARSCPAMPSDHRPVDPARAAVATVFGLVLVLLGGLMIWRKLWEARARLPAAPLPPIHRRTRPPAIGG